MKKYLQKSKKIFFFCPSIEEGGVEKNLINICNNLCNNIPVNIITANKNKEKFFNKKINFISTNNSFFSKKNRLIKSLICFFYYGKILILKVISSYHFNQIFLL